jgi:signal transduction histidine kinase
MIGQKLAAISKNRREWPFLKISTWWEVRRLGLIWAGFALVTVLIYLAFFTLIHWFSALLLQEVNRNVAVFLTTLTTLFLLRSLYNGSQKIVDNLFFPDTADFKDKIEAICQKLTELDRREALKRFLGGQLPAQLRVESIFLDTEAPEADVEGLTLPLEMGRHSLGYLHIGPKQSGRSFGYTERLALERLQDQLSLVLSGIQLAEAREAAEKIDQLKLNFLSNISHQLRTPLNTIINSTGLVADGALGEVNEAQVEFLNRAVQGSEHLMGLLNDILDITKIETGQLALQPEIIDLLEVITEVVPLVKGMLQEKPVELKIELEDNLPYFRADRLRLRQILLNLLSNAIKFTQAGFIWVRARTEEGVILVSVADTGIGIAQENLPLVFEDYQQISAKNQGAGFERRRHLGTGLGLSITKALVELHKGQIWVESEPGQGTIFTFTLPVSASQPPGEAKLSPANGRQKVIPTKIYDH